MRSEHADPTLFSYALAQKWGVMKAVILRDLRTRFFNHGLGFLMVACWPLMHLGLLLGLYNYLGRATPYGDDLNVFFATGLIPTFAFQYVARFMAISLMTHRAMLNFPAIKPTDIMAGRALLEMVASLLTVVVFAVVLYFNGDDIFPNDYTQAALAYASTLFLAVSTGLMISVIGLLYKPIVMFFTLLILLNHLTAGTLYVAASLPQSAINIISWNPVLHGVEWMRSAYYPGYPDQVLNKTYLLGFSLVMLFLALVMERFFRHIMLTRG